MKKEVNVIGQDNNLKKMKRKSFSLIFKRKNLVCKCTPNQGIVLMIKRNKN